jgi:hypothetical protein
MMRRTLTLTLALGWAACFLVQATLAPDHPALGNAAAGAFVATLNAFANALVAGLFLWLVACAASERSDGVVLPHFDWLRATFGTAAAVSLLGAIAGLVTGHAVLLGIAFLQLAALLASYLVAVRETPFPRQPRPANDNIPIGTRLLAWSERRSALLEPAPRDLAATRGRRS